MLTTWEEPTVLVLYGDHMPSLEISKDMLDLSAGGLFETEYVIWSNCGVGGADEKREGVSAFVPCFGTFETST